MSFNRLYFAAHLRHIDRSNKFFQAADSIDWFEDLKNLYDDHWFQDALKECRTIDTGSKAAGNASDWGSRRPQVMDP